MRHLPSALLLKFKLFLVASGTLAAGFLGASQSCDAQTKVLRGVALYQPFMDRSPANMKYFNRTFGDPNLLIEKRVLTDIRSAGFDTVRLPVAPRPLLEQKDDRLKKSLEEIAHGIELILAADLKVVVDLHIGAGAESWQHRGITRAIESPEFSRYLEIVRAIAIRLTAFDQSKIIFEPFNEPPAPCSWTDRADWQLFMKAIYDQIRDVAPKLTIAITGACWGNIGGLLLINPSTYDDNVLYTFHFYDPHIFTHQGTANSGDPAHYISRLPYPPPSNRHNEFVAQLNQNIENDKALTDKEKRYLNEQGRIYLARYFMEENARPSMKKKIDAVSDWARKHNVAPNRIFVGEFGVTKDMNNLYAASEKDRVSWFNDARTAFEAAGFGWIVWNYHYQGGIIVGDEWGPLDPAIIKSLGLKLKQIQ